MPAPGATSPSDPSLPSTGLRLTAEWKLKDFGSAMQLLQRVEAIAEQQKHHPDVHIEGGNRARVELWSHSAGEHGTVNPKPKGRGEGSSQSERPQSERELRQLGEWPAVRSRDGALLW